MPKSKKKPGNKVRLNMRLPVDLMEWAKGHAYENHTTITAIVVAHLMDLREKASGQVEQF